MNRSTPGLPVHHQLLEFTQTHVHWVSDAIQPSSVVPFSSCPQSLPASGSFPMSQLFAWGGQSIGVSASVSVLPMNTQDWSPFENYSGSVYQKLLPGAINPQVLSTLLLFCLRIFLHFSFTCTSFLFFAGVGGVLFQQPPNCSPPLRTTFLKSTFPAGTKEICLKQEASHIICLLDKTL